MYDKDDFIIREFPGSKRKLYRVICDICGEKQGYSYPSSKFNYCKKCQYAKLSQQFSREKIVGFCEVCGTKIERSKSQWDRAKHHVCSNSCLGIFRRKDITQVSRSHLRIKMLQSGIQPACVICGHDHIWNLQVHHKQFVCMEGANKLDNLQWMCKNCHGDLHYMEGEDTEECQN